ncbi:mechanosensitive ion channel [Salinispirillum sp. LH 10-3-1]|uniref:Mechanosensitive ion channel n=1 Tax=Salinispirillum sp. LH 10-3-1 TaxID=2952525 RepID=A0AB38YJD4_9GAMM
MPALFRRLALFTLLLWSSGTVLGQNATVTAETATIDSATLGAEIIRLNVTRQTLEERLNSVRSQHARLQQNEAALNEHILALSGSVQIYRVLQEQRTALPDVSIDPQLSDLIAETRLRQFEVTQLQRMVRDEPLRFSAFLPLEELLDELQDLVTSAVTLQSEQRALAETSARLRDSLEEQLFWIPSNRPLGVTWLLALPGQLTNQITNLPGSIRLGLDPAHLPTWRVLLAIALFISAFGLFSIRARLAQRITDINNEIQVYNDAQALWAAAAMTAEVTPESEAEAPPMEGAAVDLPEAPTPPSPWLTPTALVWVALQALPLSLLVLSFGTLLSNTSSDGIPAVGPALTAFAFSLFVVQFLRRFLSSSGIAKLHFSWSSGQRHTLLLFLSRFAWVLLPTSFVLALAEQQTMALADDILGVFVMLAAGIGIAILFSRLLKQLPKLYQSEGIHWLLTLVLVLLPLGLVVLTAFGYYYSALQLTGRFLATFYVLTGWVIAEVTVMRGVELSTSRLQLHRDREAQAARLANPAPSPDGQSITVEPEIKAEVQKVRLQTLRLARFLLLAVFGGLLYWVWADLFTAFGYLDSFVLWQYGDADSLTPMSLADLGSALFILGVTLFLAANLPGLLEMLVLSRLTLQQGSSYAITTLMNYIITTVGLVLALSSLGVSWDKLQWLVAALSVGLGFGLQEIFANFVSGLIILFERPVRIGDIVTLGNLSGRVKQIRIRATTITDFDRKDIIVPNKTFVTEQLINWTLTDTVTRVIVKVGVAYGSDLEKTRKILLKAAHANTRVLKDPEPQVLFLNFGDSTLDHELRIHVKALGDRNPGIDEINRYIDREFNKAGIEIAFQQVDIRLRNSEGIERLIEPREKP